jgi:electron transfer flavoprotein beta subunit
MVICGKQAIDGDTAQTGPGIATRLGYDQFTYVAEILDITDSTIKVKREVEGGSEIIEGRLPALLTAELELCTPRYASLPDLIRSLRQEVKSWGADEIGSKPERLGLKGSATSVRKIFSPPPHTGGQVFDQENKEQIAEDFLSTFFEKESELIKDILSKGEE